MKHIQSLPENEWKADWAHFGHCTINRHWRYVVARFKIVVIDDHQVLVDGLVSLLERETDFSVVARAKNGRDGLKAVKQWKPDLAITDICMPEMNGIDLCRNISEKVPETKVLALSMQSGHRTVRDMLKAGASGYVLKSSTYEELIWAVRDVLAGKRYFSASILDGIVEKILLSDESLSSVFGKLTDREREVARLIAEGKSAKSIAYLLEISVRTADAHKKSVFDKLHIDNVAELTRIAIREGLVDCEIH